MIRYQSDTLMDKNNNEINVDDVEKEDENFNLNQSLAKNDDNHLALDNNISAYRQQKQGSVQVVSSVLGPSILQEHVRKIELENNEDNSVARVEQNYAA